MLKILRQAATEAEAKDILTASQHLPAPFGVPVLLVDPALYARKTFFSHPVGSLKKAQQIIGARLDACIAQCPPASENDSAESTLLSVADTGYFRDTRANIEKKILDTIQAFESMPHGNQFIAAAYPLESPRISIAFFHSPDADTAFAANGIDNRGKKLPRYPGYEAQHLFQILWHEFAHSVSGSNEPGAEKLSSMVCRYAFKDCTFLKVHADQDAVQSILRFNDESFLEKYGWPCVEAIDKQQALQTPPTWDDIMRAASTAWATPHVSRIADIRAVGAAVHSTSRPSFLFKDMSGMADAAAAYVQRGNAANAAQQEIGERFALAAQRLAIGEKAYAVTSMNKGTAAARGKSISALDPPYACPNP